MHKKQDKFLKLPEYPGGKEQFKLFVKSNLKYPDVALKNRVEGLVLLSAEITDKGDIQNIKVEKGIGSGCDEEAVRVLSLMKFGSVKNRGLRVKTSKKFKINFNLPKNTGPAISYKIKEKDKIIPEKPQVNYSYTITIGGNN